MKTCGIYGLYNTINGKWYVGQSVDLEKRKSGHFYRLRNGTHTNQHLQHSFAKYGCDSFEFRILEEVPENMLDVRECAWIDFYKSDQSRFGFNLESGGNVNKHVSDETRRKQSESLHREKHYNYGKHPSEATLLKMSESHKGEKSLWFGKHLPAETRQKLSEAQKGNQNAKGCYRSEETRRKLSVSNKGKHFGTLSSEHKLKISEAIKGVKHPMYGEHHSEESRRKMSEVKKGKYPSNETRSKMSASQKLRFSKCQS